MVNINFCLHLMQYVALLVAFLCEMTAYPVFIKNPIHIESVMIAYFTIILATNKKVSVIFPVILMMISSIITARIAGLSSFLLMLGAFVYYQFFVSSDRLKYSVKKPTHASVISIFSILFLIMLILKVIILYSFGYSISPLLEFFTYIINIAIFIIFTICVL